jgi:hypothetical protein
MEAYTMVTIAWCHKYRLDILAFREWLHFE